MKTKITYVFLFVSLIILYSCSPSSTNNVFNFLFDGVPSTDTLKSVNEQVVKSDSLLIPDKKHIKTFTATLVFHEPYKEKMCESCHDINASNKKIMSMPELCYQCHDDFQSAYKNIHYPVEAGECNSCHHPHQAKLAKLLLKPVRELCADCHDLGDLLAGDMHSGIDDADCTDCHDPHGSNDSSLLK